MKRIYTIMLLVFPLCIFSQTNLKDGIEIKSHSFDKSSDNNLVVSMLLSVQKDFKVSSNRMITITPFIESKDLQYNKVLKPVYLYGRNRQIIQKRENAIDPNAYKVLRRKNGTTQDINYLVNLPYEKWMEGSNVELNIDLCGCANKNEVSDKRNVAQISINEKSHTIVPVIAFIKPKVEEVKSRTDVGKAYLSYPLNKSFILASFGNNDSELDKIKSTINIVKNDNNTTITKICIVGYASPDGPYNNNKILSEARAKSLKDYVANIYHYDNSIMSVSSVAEDWDGVKKYVDSTNINKKNDITSIIESSSLSDDQKEMKIKELGDRIYSKLYNDCYPPLRRCDYQVNYTVRNFTLDEAKQIIATHPKQLSLNEMYRVAQTYNSGTPEYNNVFRTAVAIFPDDETANLNASAIALQHNDLELAQEYLLKSNKELPETLNNMGALMILKGDFEKAKEYLNKAKTEGSKQAIENLHLLQENEK